jgi:hypothetical protein
MKRKQLVQALASIGLGLAVSGTANAAITVFSPIWGFEDDDIEFIFDLDKSGTLTKGDRVLAVGEFIRTHNGAGTSAPVGPPEELTFVADALVATEIDVGGVATVFGFAPNPTGVLVTGGYGATAMVAAFTDSKADLNVIGGACGTQAACMALAGLGATTVPGSGPDGSTLFAVVGFGDPDDAWFTDIIPDKNTSIATIQGGGSSTSFVSYNFAQTVLTNNTGQTIGLQPCGIACSGAGDGLTQFVGSGNLLGGAGLNPADWTARSDNDAEVRVIPEPATLALLGAALAGAGFLRRRESTK